MPKKSRRMKMSSVERLRRRLAEERGRWSAIALAAGVSYKTLVRFANAATDRPWGAFLKKLDEHFVRVDGSA